MKNLHSMGLRVEDGRVWVLDQRRLPQEEIWVDCHSPDEMVQMIVTLAVRGAPLIGVAAAVALAGFAGRGADPREFSAAADRLQAARPTAVNLMWAVRRMQNVQQGAAWADRVVEEAELIFEEDVNLCRKIAENGQHLIEDGDGVLTHCNAGALATAGIGTAVGVIRHAWEMGRKIHVFVDETRPLLQGGRLTAWELSQLGIPYTLICDNMAATLMRQGKITKAIVGADRIAANGDFANKVGTYSVAVLCHHHSVPFFTAAPYSTVDMNCPSGQEIPIEERDPNEVRGLFSGLIWSPADCGVYNPAFDVTPVELLTGIILDRGYYSRQSLTQAGRLPSFS